MNLTQAICQLLNEGSDGLSYLIIKQEGDKTTKIGKTTNPIKDYHGKDSSKLYFVDIETNAAFVIKGGKLTGHKRH